MHLCYITIYIMIYHSNWKVCDWYILQLLLILDKKIYLSICSNMIVQNISILRGFNMFLCFYSLQFECFNNVVYIKWFLTQSAMRKGYMSVMISSWPWEELYFWVISWFYNEKYHYYNWSLNFCLWIIYIRVVLRFWYILGA